jgi:Family of unknown function (DUF6191)
VTTVFALTLPGVVVLLIAAGIVLQLSKGASGRRDRASASAGFDALGVVLDPAERHRLAEKRREEVRRDVVEDGAPPRSRIDLSAGTAHLHLPHHE